MSVLANSAETISRFNLQNIIDARGYAIAITGMSIVFVALSLISLFLALLPRMLRVLSKVFPEPASQPAAPPLARVRAGDDEIVAAIGAALHRHHGGP
jgi:oxaloacetate decarboxylase gamma subunit